jgi:hypothetical protein
MKTQSSLFLVELKSLKGLKYTEMLKIMHIEQLQKK